VEALKESSVCISFRNTALLQSHAVKLSDRYLSTEERARRDRLHFEEDRRDFTIAHDLLRRALSRYADVPPADWRFVTNEYGKPSIIAPEVRPLSFSLSYTRGCVACAITSNAALGVDVERIDQFQRAQEIADRYFSKAEASWLRQCSADIRNARFAELWTLKESFLKAIGVGLFGSLSDLSFRFDEYARIDFSGPSTIDPHEWHFALFEPAHGVRLGIVTRSVAQPRFFLREADSSGEPFAAHALERTFWRTSFGVRSS